MGVIRLKISRGAISQQGGNTPTCLFTNVFYGKSDTSSYSR